MGLVGQDTKEQWNLIFIISAVLVAVTVCAYIFFIGVFIFIKMIRYQRR